ncbi:MAG: LacI family DNA-binding transcriptional regulator [Chthoniobacteraceae bacterium]|nr:LacI family DNA-binding transcriptional regulator [Chthoniobacteraceae bacterium]
MISSLELARRCGVSQGTVDRALHGRPGISPRTRDRILAAAEQCGYRPNPAARELITGQSGLVGAVLPSVNNVFFMDLFHELAKRLRERGLRLQLAPVETRAEFLAALDDFAARRHRMALVIPPEDGIPIPRPVARQLPVVSLVSPCKGAGIHFLAPDEEETGRTAVRYLHGRGHRRILHLTYARQSYAIKARARGYAGQARETGLQPHILAGVDRESLARALRAARPTALFCHNDWLALTALLLLSERGIRVPEDVSILGVDNSPTFAAINPHLTTLAYPMEAMARAVLDILDGKPGSLAGERFPVIERETVRDIESAV